MNILSKFFGKYTFLKNHLRTIRWRLLLSRMGRNSRILGKVTINNPENVYIGDYTTINEGSYLNARARIVIGDHVHISPFCVFNTGGLIYSKKLSKRNHFEKEIKIENGAWVGSGAILNPGVVIGENSVVGAGAVVTKNVQKNVVVVGVPAKFLKKIES